MVLVTLSYPPANKLSLMRFCAHLVDRLHHSSIELYLSAVRSLHTDYGYPDPLYNCLQLQPLLRGIKRHQVFKSPSAPACDWQSLDLSNLDNIMLWAACCLGFFGFLRAGEFTVNSSFDASLDLTPADLQADSTLNTQSFGEFIKCTKTDPFQCGCFIFLDQGSISLCPVLALTSYLHLHGQGATPLFIFQDGRHGSFKGLAIFVFAIHLTGS